MCLLLGVPCVGMQCMFVTFPGKLGLHFDKKIGFLTSDVGLCIGFVLSSTCVQRLLYCVTFGEKTCLRGLENNKGTNQPTHLRSLISVFVIRILDSTITCI